jgi:hypothetical protein
VFAALDRHPGGVGVAGGEIGDLAVPRDRDAPSSGHRDLVLVDQHDVEVSKPFTNPADILLRLQVGGDERGECAREQFLKHILGPYARVGTLHGHGHAEGYIGRDL